MNHPLRIALISKDAVLNSHLQLHLQSKDYQVIILTKYSSVLGFIYSDPPDIIIINISAEDGGTRSLIKEIKKDNYFSAISVIGIIAEHRDELLDWENYSVDDFISQPVKYSELFSRISLSIMRVQRVFDNNPLTKLPGNTSIQHAIEKSLGKPMAVCYIDINNFKPFNDTYGFTRGDEVIRMVARIMSNAVKEKDANGFVGHIGGDDFVFIVPLEIAESISKTIIDNIDVIIPELFGDEEISKGYYTSVDRRGQEQRFPLLGIAIAIVPTNTPKMQHYGNVAAVAAELKKYAKQSNKNCYVIDRRIN